MTKICIEFEPDAGTPGAGAQFFSTTLGDGVTTVFNVNHSLDSLDALTYLRDAFTGEADVFDVAMANVSADVTRLTFATPPTLGQVRVNVMAPPSS